MANWMFFGTPLTGHTNPTLPLVTELIQRGERVVYYNSKRFESPILGTGAEFRPYRSLQEPPSPLSRRMQDLLPWITRAIDAVLDNELKDVLADPPDFVIYDCVAVWGAEVSRLTGVPRVGSVPTFAFNRAVELAAKKVMPRALRPGKGGVLLRDWPMIASSGGHRIRTTKKHGLDYQNLFELAYGEINVVFTSPSLQPCSDQFGDNFFFVGSPAVERDENIKFPFDELNDLPLLYISLGTSVNDRPGFYEACFEAFRDMDIQVVLSRGAENKQLAGLHPPGNFRVYDYVPQIAILQRADAFITHGGVGSASEALHFGVPQVFLPQIWDGYFMAHQVAKHGGGVVLSDRPAASEIKQAVQRVMSDKSFREKSRELGQGLKDAGGAPRAAEGLIKWGRWRLQRPAF